MPDRECVSYFSLTFIRGGLITLLMKRNAKQPVESTRSIWEGLWADYISAIRSGSATRIAQAKVACDAFNAAL